MKFPSIGIGLLATAYAGAMGLGDKNLDSQWIESLTHRGGDLDTKIVGSKEDGTLKYIGMPVGGIGCGTVYLGGDGRLFVWDIFNQFHEGVVANKAELPPELEVRYQSQHKGALLKERDGANYISPPTPERDPGGFEQGFGLRIGDRLQRFEEKHWAEVEFRGDWPIGTVSYRDPKTPVDVSLRAFSPFTPLELDDSALPVTVMEYTLRNTSSQPVTAALSGWLENAVGLHTRKSHGVELKSEFSEHSELRLLQHSAVLPKGRKASDKRPDIVFESFEGVNSYGTWKVEGDAFGTLPVHKHNVPDYMGGLKLEGERTANSHASAPGKTLAEKDESLGKLISPTFTIDRDYLHFLIGGGMDEKRLCLNLIVDGETVRSATGKESNAMEAAIFDLREWQGRKAHIEVIDSASGSWGNIGVDHIIFSDTEPDAELSFAEAGDFGSMALAVMDASASAIEYDGIPGWESEVLLQPGESKTVTFTISWNFPNIYKLWGFPDEKNYYSTRFVDAESVALYTAKNFARLKGNTEKWTRVWYDSTLPEWFMDRTLLTTNTLQTANSWIFDDGQFWAWEGVGACAGTCTHVWGYAQGVGRLFPSLERNLREVTDFGYAQDLETGMIDFRGVNNASAVDGQAGIVLRTLREHQMSPNSDFLKRVWPKCKFALEGLMHHDTDSDGILDGPQHNTLDSAWYGEVAWLSGHYLAAVKAGEALAHEMRDDEFADECRQLVERGSLNVVERLFDPKRGYFINRVDPSHPASVNSGTGCHIDQVFGQSWAFQVGLDRVLPAKEAHSALRKLWDHNFLTDVSQWRLENKPGRWYAVPGEGGLLMCTFPYPDWDYTRALGVNAKYAWSAMYFNECMSGFEYQVASHMVFEGEPDLIQKGLAITRTIHDRYNPSKRNPYNEIECSDHYARAAASYGVFLAACGFEYHGPDKQIGFDPRVSPEDFKAPFTSAEGWGSYRQQQNGDAMNAELVVEHGVLDVRTVTLRLPEGAKAGTASVSLNGIDVPCSTEIKEGRTVLSLSRDVELKEGQRLNILFKSDKVS
ncbi:GH116 family glycosyl-hydrolase [Pelagicoccus mobilis]|uniref:Glycosyl-hydrolase family 116 catalytic region domain-containing protein n=1 Tax=Pelagicoccus mobilis TaxID=415221 RepID=A0A934VN59_9BACT|nr:GH116 family glycosyl-hydrolase [Pelagicoccus mobilis]MBK1875887.1 hypothetical protein [Pelagicoccus mobilis]